MEVIWFRIISMGMVALNCLRQDKHSYYSILQQRQSNFHNSKSFDIKSDLVSSLPHGQAGSRQTKAFPDPHPCDDSTPHDPTGR